MGHFSVKIIAPDGSNLNGNQQHRREWSYLSKVTNSVMGPTRAISMVNEKLKEEGGLVAINYITIGANAKSSNKSWITNIGNEWGDTTGGL